MIKKPTNRMLQRSFYFFRRRYSLYIKTEKVIAHTRYSIIYTKDSSFQIANF